MEGIKKLLDPKRVAVIGVSREPGKIGQIVFDNLLFSGREVYGVNPNADQILGQKIYSSVLDVPAKIDLAVICVPVGLVSQVLESCGKKKIPFAILITAGFSEAGDGGKEKEAEIGKISQKFGIRILGPNCLGVINNFNNLNASFATPKMPAKYRVGVFSQSGAMGAALLDYANGTDFGFSYFVSLGNKIDISEIDLLSSWKDDENVAVAIGYLEDVKNGSGFVEAARAFTAKKPLVILKGGMTKSGEKAARLHTGALACDEVVFRAAMEEAGVIVAEDLNDLFEVGASFAQNHLPTGNRLAIISNAGGPSVLAADAVSKEGVLLAELSNHSIIKLSRETQAASLSNPIDLRGDANKEDFKRAFDVCERDRGVDGILAVVTPQAMTEVEAIAWEAVVAKKEGKKPVYLNFIGGELVKKAEEILAENGVATFKYPERAVRAFRYQADFQNRRYYSVRGSQEHPKHGVAKSLLGFSGTNLSMARLSSLLNIYGIKLAETVVVKNVKEVAGALSKLGTPLVMKIAAEDILHKTDIGGVMLGIETQDEAEKAFEKIIANVRAHKPNVKIQGVTMTKMAKEGLEVILGAKKDPLFGPIIMFGFGGVFVELVSDFAVAIAPFDEDKIERLIEKTNVAKIIKGYRGKKYNKKALTGAIKGIGQLITEHPEIREIEINPLILEESGNAIGLDAKIELSRGVDGC